MSTDKNQLATDVRHQAQILQQSINQAKKAGLTIEISSSSKYLGPSDQIQVVVFERVEY